MSFRFEGVQMEAHRVSIDRDGLVFKVVIRRVRSDIKGDFKESLLCV